MLLMKAEDRKLQGRTPWAEGRSGQRDTVGRGMRGMSVEGAEWPCDIKKVDKGVRSHRDNSLASQLAPWGNEGSCQSGGERQSFRRKPASAFVSGELAPLFESLEDPGRSFLSSLSLSFRL